MSDANVKLIRLLKFSHFHQNSTKTALSFYSSRFVKLAIGTSAVLVANHLEDSYDLVIPLKICVTTVFEVAQYLHRTNYSFAAQSGFDSHLRVIQIIIAGWLAK